MEVAAKKKSSRRGTGKRKAGEPNANKIIKGYLYYRRKMKELMRD